MKSFSTAFIELGGTVAPFAGAWIEIYLLYRVLCIPRSLPLRERGLKSVFPGRNYTDPLSLPLRERGLKCTGITITSACHRVAPFAGAWIEII